MDEKLILAALEAVKQSQEALIAAIEKQEQLSKTAENASKVEEVHAYDKTNSPETYNPLFGKQKPAVIKQIEETQTPSGWVKLPVDEHMMKIISHAKQYARAEDVQSKVNTVLSESPKQGWELQSHKVESTPQLDTYRFMFKRSMKPR